MNFVDQRLTPHFMLSEYLLTDRQEFWDKNHTVSQVQIDKLRQVATMEEIIRDVLGCKLHNHSGYRCPELNSAIGSTARSQHMLCEAVDFDRLGQTYTPETLDQDFNKIVAAARAGRLKLGQLIKEQATRYSKTGITVSMWIHASLGAPWRPAERCGQLLAMKDGVYTSLGTV